MIYTIKRITKFENLILGKTKSIDEALKIAIEKDELRFVNIVLANNNESIQVLMSISNKNIEVYENSFLDEKLIKQKIFEQLTGGKNG